MAKVKIIQIAATGNTVYGLDSKGYLYRFHVQMKEWIPVEPEVTPEV